MKLVKQKKSPFLFDLKDLTPGKLMAIQSALEASEKNGTLGPVGKDVLILLNNERKNFING